MAERILFITATRIGDAVLTSGVLDHLLTTRPNARVTVATGPAAADLFRATPRLDAVIAPPKQRWGGHWVKLWRRTAARRWDLVVDMRGSRTAWFLRAKKAAIAAPPRFDRHKIEEAASVLKLAPAPAPRIWLDDAARAAAHAALPGDQPTIAIAPAAAARFKEWPAERFGALAAALTDPGGAFAGARVAVLGGPGDAETARRAAAALPAERAVVLAGETTLDLLASAACLERCALFVGNCSGMMHVASAVGAPTVGLYGPTDERLYGPRGPRGLALRAGEQIDARARARLKDREESLLADLSVAFALERVTAFARGLPPAEAAAAASASA